MKNSPAAFLVTLAAVFALLFPGRSTISTPQPPGAQAESKASTTTSVTQTQDDTSAAVATHWQEPIRLYREFFGISFKDSKPEVEDSKSEGPPAIRPEDLREIAKRAHAQSYDLDFMIALVPDPVDSNLAANFDQALEALQLAFANSGYLLDRFWLPWSGEAEKGQARTYRSTPGVLLFRDPSQVPRKLTAVFLVGETPKQGIHKRSFDAALRLIMDLKAAVGPSSGSCLSRLVGPDPVEILGPSFSGSAESLRIAFSDWPEGTFRVVTGTATAPGLDLGTKTKFERAVVADDVLQTDALAFFEDLGWDLDKVAMLHEFDTSYGQLKSDPKAPEKRRDKPLQVSFPGGLSEIRTAWEKSAKPQAPNGDKNAITVPQQALELSLVDQSKPVDIVPHFSALSIDSSDLALSNLLESIWREGIRYVGILATDPRDKIFLAERVRRFSPDVLLFTFDNNLLYSHPQYSDKMDGTLVLSSFPLLTETGRFRELLGGPDGRYARQFSSEFEEGIYNATRLLLGQPQTPPRTWIAAVGGGSLWPIAALPKLPTPNIRFDRLANREDLQFLALMAILCLSAVCLGIVYPHLDLAQGAGGIDRTARCLLALGSSVLCLGGDLLVVLGTIPLWASGALWRPDLWGGVFQALYLAVLLGAYGFLVAYGARLIWPVAASGKPTKRRHRLAWKGVWILLVPILAVGLQYLWMPGGAPFFYLRARKFSSGLSPVVSLALLVSAFYAWVVLELKRRRSIARQAIRWPLRAHIEPPLAGSREMAVPLYKAIHLSLPQWRSRKRGKLSTGQTFWLVFAIAITPPTVRLLRAVQPICERRLYGQIFLLAALAAFGLCVISFYQFFSLWLALEKLLQRLDNSRMAKAFKRISDEVGWKPMKSFWWQLTTFKMLVLSAEKLRRIDRRAKYWSAGRMEGIDRELSAMFEADRSGKIGEETVARRRLNGAFSRAGYALAADAGDPEIEEFFALRIVAYLRPFVGHMRNCITAALLSGLLVLFAVRNYAFEPKWFISAMTWSFLSVVIAVTLWVFVQMDKNASLSAIGGTDPGKVTFDRHFLANVLLYGAVPLIGVAVTQFPEVGKFFAGWFNPLLQVVSLH